MYVFSVSMSVGRGVKWCPVSRITIPLARKIPFLLTKSRRRCGSFDVASKNQHQRFYLCFRHPGENGVGEYRTSIVLAASFFCRMRHFLRGLMTTKRFLLKKLDAIEKRKIFLYSHRSLKENYFHGDEIQHSLSFPTDPVSQTCVSFQGKKLSDFILCSWPSLTLKRYIRKDALFYK